MPKFGMSGSGWGAVISGTISGTPLARLRGVAKLPALGAGTQGVGISRLNRLLGAEHDHLPIGGQVCQGVCKARKSATLAPRISSRMRWRVSSVSPAR